MLEDFGQFLPGPKMSQFPAEGNDLLGKVFIDGWVKGQAPGSGSVEVLALKGFSISYLEIRLSFFQQTWRQAVDMFQLVYRSIKA